MAPILSAFAARPAVSSAEIPWDFALDKQQTTIKPIAPKASSHLHGLNPLFAARIADGMPNRMKPMHINVLETAGCFAATTGLTLDLLVIAHNETKNADRKLRSNLTRSGALFEIRILRKAVPCLIARMNNF
jgi:hypothetical protein